METMYWITRLDAICVAFNIIMVFCIIGTLAFIICRIINKAAEYEDNAEQAGKIATGLIAFVSILPISIAAVIFVPDTKEALVIYGVGGTLEWIKENDNAKQIPDKAVEALNLYLDNIMEQQSKPTQDSLANSQSR